MTIQLEASVIGMKVTLDMSATEFTALQKTLAMGDSIRDQYLSPDGEQLAIQQMSRNLNRIKLGGS